MVRLLAVLACLLVPRLADASTAMVESEKLLGWSDDGQTWAVLKSSQADTVILVKKRGKVVLEVCNAADDRSGTCKKSRKTTVVDVEGSDTLSGLERLNIESHKAFKRFKLKRVSASWRAGFKKLYTLEYGRYGNDSWGKRCTKGWKLVRKADNKIVKRAQAKGSDCLKPIGGYLSTSGKYLLLEIESAKEPDASGDSYEETSYLWLKV